eukprot:scpid50566/ scgid31784/ 
MCSPVRVSMSGRAHPLAMSSHCTAVSSHCMACSSAYHEPVYWNLHHCVDIISESWLLGVDIIGESWLLGIDIISGSWLLGTDIIRMCPSAEHWLSGGSDSRQVHSSVTFPSPFRVVTSATSIFHHYTHSRARARTH